MGTLERMANSGEFGELRYHLSSRKIIEAYGDPPNKLADKHESIWKYGNLQITFDSESLSKTCVEKKLLYFFFEFYDESDDYPKGIPLAGWLPRFGTTEKAFFERMNIMNLDYKNDDKQVIDSQRCYLVGKHLKVYFNTQENFTPIASMYCFP